MDKYLILALGGVIGTISRYLIGIYSVKILGAGFPYGTLIVNTVGSFVIGFFMTIFLGKLSLDPLWRLFIAVGFCGSFTTMSSFAYETLALLMDGEYIKAGLNILLNVILSFGFTFLGITIGRILT